MKWPTEMAEEFGLTFTIVGSAHLIANINGALRDLEPSGLSHEHRDVLRAS